MCKNRTKNHFRITSPPITSSLLSNIHIYRTLICLLPRLALGDERLTNVNISLCGRRFRMLHKEVRALVHAHADAWIQWDTSWEITVSVDSWHSPKNGTPRSLAICSAPPVVAGKSAVSVLQHPHTNDDMFSTTPRMGTPVLAQNDASFRTSRRETCTY